MKVFVLAPKEDWIVDRLTKEFNEGNSDIVVNSPQEADTIWLFANWAWNHIPYELLKTKRVITTVHHIVPEKWNAAAERDFKACDSITTEYHVPNAQTAGILNHLTKKAINIIPYWVNQNVWTRSQTCGQARASLGLGFDKFLIGSFQRDTEGHDLISPKLEKGPDTFCDFIAEMTGAAEYVEVILTGWRRQYVMRRLDEAHVKYRLFEKVPISQMIQLYSALDLYVVSSRWEGGPQALLECAAMQVPIISTPVGMAQDVLSPESIGPDLEKLQPNVRVANQMVQKMMLPQGFDKYRTLLTC